MIRNFLLSTIGVGALLVLSACGSSSGNHNPFGGTSSTTTTVVNATATATAVTQTNTPNTVQVFNVGTCEGAIRNGEGYPGPTTAKAKADLGIDVQRNGSECASWTFRDPTGTTHMSTCLEGYTCTYTLPDKSVQLFVGDGRSRAASAATYRWKAGYPMGDKVNESPPCRLADAEDHWGVKEDPSFRAHAGNFSCPASSNSSTQATSSSVNSGGGNTPAAAVCDPNRDAIGGTWTSQGNNQWSLTGQATVTGNSRYTIHTPGYPGDPGLPVGQSESTAAATAYCK